MKQNHTKFEIHSISQMHNKRAHCKLKLASLRIGFCYLNTPLKQFTQKNDQFYHVR